MGTPLSRTELNSAAGSVPIHPKAGSISEDAQGCHSYPRWQPFFFLNACAIWPVSAPAAFRRAPWSLVVIHHDAKGRCDEDDYAKTEEDQTEPEPGDGCAKY